MDYALHVRRPESLRNLADDRSGFRRGQFAAFFNYVGQVAAFHIRHADEPDATLIADVINLDDVGVRDPAGKEQFLFEASDDLGVGSPLRPDHFQCGNAGPNHDRSPGIRCSYRRARASLEIS